jgi:hypothetical protein
MKKKRSQEPKALKYRMRQARQGVTKCKWNAITGRMHVTARESAASKGSVLGP